MRTASGITIRGAKMLGTSSIMANEVFVANLQPLKPGEEALAFSCALPMNAKGLRVLSRKSYEQHRRFRSSTIRSRRASTKTTR